MATIPLSLSYIEQAGTTHSFTEGRYQSGSATILELLDAENALTQARFRYLSAQYEASNRWFALQRAAGIQFW
jgi:outer membrane protein TolC